MKMRSQVLTFLVCILVLGLTTLGVYAFGHGKMKSHGDGFENKFYGKACFMMENSEELGLSDETVKKIKELKLKTKKDLIKKDAEIDVLALDIKAAMMEDSVDITALNALIDKKYELKKEKAKVLAGSYAALKGMLTAEQKDKMKKLWKCCKKEKMGGSMMKGGMCPMMGGKMSDRDENM